MMPVAIERMDARLDAVEAALRASEALQAYVIKRNLMHFDAHEPGEIEQGVLMLVSAGERDYADSPGMAAREGTQRVLVIGHLQVDHASAPIDIERAELSMAENLKTFVRAGVAGMSVQLIAIEHSRQLEHPYGWVVADITLGPPQQSYY